MLYLVCFIVMIKFIYYNTSNKCRPMRGDENIIRKYYSITAFINEI